MDAETAQRLNQLNQDFYTITAPHFHQSRGAAWFGWEKLLPHIPSTDPLMVLDVGCGNGRFGLFLADNLSQAIHYHGLDSSSELLTYAKEDLQGQVATLHLEQHDVVSQPVDCGSYDLVVLFGVIHHVPGREQRLALVKSLAGRVVPGGVFAFAAWRFYEYPRFRDRIVTWPEDFDVEDHDYLLDWRSGVEALRYCHYVDDEEHQKLVNATGLRELVSYRADGKSGDQNLYSILAKPLPQQ
jgi:SAM-dependent methyltransferase